jgi:flavin-dependent dehydrogenase
MAAGAALLGPPQFEGAGSQIVATDAAQTLIPVGDAASSFDPVSGQGIVRALRSGVFASYAIADQLERENGDGMRRYARVVTSEFSAYRQTLHDYYAQEQRWPDGAFWRRRHNHEGAGSDRVAGEVVSADAATPLSSARRLQHRGP